MAVGQSGGGCGLSSAAVTIAAAGVDTWSVGWYANDSDAACRAMTELACVPSKRSRLLADKIGGYRVGWFPSSGLVFAEGHPNPDGLGWGDALAGEEERVWSLLRDYGIPLFRESAAGVRRLDSTVDMRFADPALGLLSLYGVATVQFPRVKTEVITERGGSRIETVYLMGNTGKFARYYDKGVESMSAPRGTLLRPEDQRRFPKSERCSAEVVDAAFVRSKFHQRFVPLWKASQGVKIGGAMSIAKHLKQLVADQKITAGQARRYAGFLQMESVGLDQGPDRTYYRLRAECREAGVYQLPEVGDVPDVEIDLAAIFEQALDTDAWGVG